MPAILLDEDMPFGLVRLLPGRDVRHVLNTEWAGLANGRLIDAAEAAGFDVLVTADCGMRHQQNWTGRRLCLVVLSTNNRPVIRRNVEGITAALDAAVPGGWREVVCDG